MVEKHRLGEKVSRIVIVHSVPIIRSGLARILTTDFVKKTGRAIEVVSYDTVNEASNAILLRRPNLVIFQHDFRGMPLESVVATIERNDLSVRVIAFHKNWKNVGLGRLLGGQLYGALSLQDDMETIISTVDACLDARRVVRSKLRRVTSRPHSRRRVPDRRAPGITGREVQVLQCIADGRSLQSTADHLGVSVSTVKNIRHALYAKLNVPNGGAAVAYGKEMDLIR